MAVTGVGAGMLIRRSTPVGAFVTWHVLAGLAVLGAILLVVQRQRSASELAVAIGPVNAEQKAFFERSAERPDLELFFKGLSPAQRIQLAENLGVQATPAAAQMAASLLTTFDEAARTALTSAMVQMAKKDPGLVTPQLSRTGSFELQGVFAALYSAFPGGIEAAAQSLGDPARRANTIRFLVEGAQNPDRSATWKTEVERVLLPKLRAEDEALRTGAAEVLGKLRLRAAVAPLLTRFDIAEAAERTVITGALADIGDPRAETTLLSQLDTVAGSRARILAGLGRMATNTSLARLLAAYESEDREGKEQALAGLVLAENRALDFITEGSLRLEVASRLQTQKATDVLRAALLKPGQVRAAIRASKHREGLADSLWNPNVAATDPTVPARMAALATTRRGREILRGLEADPKLGGLARRALLLADTKN